MESLSFLSGPIIKTFKNNITIDQMHSLIGNWTFASSGLTHESGKEKTTKKQITRNNKPIDAIFILLIDERLGR